jgi:hypothetical protein
MARIPTRAQLVDLALQALEELGGTARAREIRAKAGEAAGLTPEEMAFGGPLSSARRSQFSHGIDWALQTLKARGLVRHDGRRPARWSIIPRDERLDADSVSGHLGVMTQDGDS